MVHMEEILALSTEHGFPFYLGLALAFRGRSLIALGQAQEGLALLTQGLAELRATGAVVRTPITAHVACRGLRHARAACRSTELPRRGCADRRDHRGAGSLKLSCYRVPGDLLNAAGDRSGAERHYRQAIAVAERQSAKLFQLRASTSLARLWRDQGKRAEARDLLGPIYDWFTEGFDAPDLKDAKALLDELA